ncbi:MAG: Fis family transcriptional regulator [Candidatus Diapherotrites archaeon]|nr:Fis family transcriptional regulator [Candidatus Diapherotrites archaeon]
MKPFCEEVGRKTLPAIRALIANELAKKGLTGREISKAMGVTPASVTHYLHKSRGKLSVKDKIPKTLVEDFVDKLANGKLTDEERVEGLCSICKTIRGVAN